MSSKPQHHPETRWQWRISCTSDLMNQKLHFNKTSRWFTNNWSLRSLVLLRLWQMPPSSPEESELFETFLLISYHELSEAARSMSTLSSPSKAINWLTQQIFMVCWLCAKCLWGRTEMYVNIAVLHPIAFLLRTPSVLSWFSNDVAFQPRCYLSSVHPSCQILLTSIHPKTIYWLPLKIWPSDRIM